MIDISTINTLAILTGITVVGASFFTTVNPRPPENPHESVRDAVLQFIEAGDSRNVVALDSVLHPEFRVVANQLNGGSTTTVITRSDYLALIAAGKLGGDKRTVKIESLEVVQNNAAVKATITGTTMVFQSFYHVIRTEKGQWQLIQDLPFISKK